MIINRLPSFSRRKSRGFTEKQKLLLQSNFYDLQHLLSIQGNIYWHGKLYNRCHLEIGFGSGDHLLKIAQENPNDLFIGAEVFLNGVVSLMTKLANNDVKNVMIYRDDIRIFLQKMPEISLNEIHILFPDPWPKKKHRKKRLLNYQFLALLLQSAKKIVIATDCYDYSEEISRSLNIFQANGKIEYNKLSIKTEDECQKYNILTKYAVKALFNDHNISHYDISIL